MLTRPVLLYDGECNFCLTWVRRLRRWDRHERIEMIPFQERERIPELPPISQEALNKWIHLVRPDGQVSRGGGIIPELLRYLPGGWILRPVFWIPGVQWLVNRGYDWVSARRHQLGCGSAACSWRP